MVLGVALIKLLQQKYSETFFCQLREDANADVLAIEKKYRQEVSWPCSSSNANLV